ncbi:winged helix-turn-helix domain-containing protein [uncultured Treponema sp.]|uniref:winged helix-turn-helix domain-containing protein n=1 Tax=uncultured Treponema sp. TaxID=162155 RepID=UPI00262B6C0F|nr:winged helix-turn-helix domain-containing protein [uncultured Treponema sp.]
MKEIPDYQTLMLPVLESVADGKEHKFREITASTAKNFGLTEEELGCLLPSGNQSIFDNRVGWAKTYLKKACLIEYKGKGVLKITERGK